MQESTKGAIETGPLTRGHAISQSEDVLNSTGILRTDPQLNGIAQGIDQRKHEVIVDKKHETLKEAHGFDKHHRLDIADQFSGQKADNDHGRRPHWEIPAILAIAVVLGIEIFAGMLHMTL